MQLPSLSHLQFAVIDSLISGEKYGRALREILKEKGVKKSGPAFYQLMSRLEDAGFIEGRYENKMVRGQTVRERVYGITSCGAEAYREVTSFYSQIGQDSLGEMGIQTQ